jgi:hypothetical protein
MGKKRKHTTTKNTVAKPPVRKLAEITIDINGEFTIVTELPVSVFDMLYKEWWDHPATFMWCGESLIAYIKEKHPNSICLFKEDFEKITKGKLIHATKQEYEAENN